MMFNDGWPDNFGPAWSIWRAEAARAGLLTEREQAAQFWWEFAALDHNINKLDPLDPVWSKPTADDDEEGYNVRYRHASPNNPRIG